MKIERGFSLEKFVSDFRYLAWGLTYLFVLFALIPTGPSVGKVRFLDKFLHFLGFYFMVFSFTEGYGEKHRLKFFIFALFLGLSIEGVQALIPWRDADYLDFLTNSVGAFLAFVTPVRVSKIIIYLITTLLGIGEIPLAPATWASAVTLIVFYISPFQGDFLILLLPVIFVMGVYLSSRMVTLLEDNDPRKVVIDETFGVLLTVSFFPKSIPYYVIGFLLFRFFDVKKPFPLRYVERLPRGLGVMMDDLVAGVYAAFGLYFVSLIDKIFPFGLF